MKLLFLRLKDRFGGNFLFFFLVLFIYLLTGLFNFEYFIKVGLDFYNILVHQILAVLGIVFIFMFVLNILLQKDKIKNLIKNSSSLTKYIFSVIGGIFSTGPVYMWYPFLKKLKDHGLNYGHIATFIYARAIKIPFLFVMIFYFGLKYTIIFNSVLIILSIFIGILVNLFFNFLNYEKNNS